MIQSSLLSERHSSFAQAPNALPELRTQLLKPVVHMWICSTEAAEQWELHVCVLSQRSDCLVNSCMVKVNKQWLGYCAADWKGNYIAAKTGRCAFACIVFMCEIVCRGAALCSFLSVVSSFSWQWVFQLTCQCYSAYRAVKWPTTGLTWGTATSFSFSLHTVAP